MKILHISTTDIGGAAKACIRLHEGLLNDGIDSNILFFNLTTNSIPGSYSFHQYYYQEENKKYHTTPIGIKAINKIKNKLGKDDKSRFYKLEVLRNDLLKNRISSSSLFTFPESIYRVQEHPLYKEADIVHLHWVSNFLDYKSFFANKSKKLVWTLHDMNAFTGGCHYSDGCQKFQIDCKACPQLSKSIGPDYTSQVLQLKQQILSGIEDIRIISPSIWMKNVTEKSILFKRYTHLHIPNGINSQIFMPRQQEFSRELLNIPNEHPVILFAASSINDTRKGFDYLIEALKQIQTKCTLCVVGSGYINIPDMHHSVIRLNAILDERLLSAVYSAADMFIIPSIEDNLPNTVLESLMCGTPVVGFPIGGIVDMVQHKRNGLISEEINVESLAKTIELALSLPFNRQQIRLEAVNKYDSSIQAKAYIQLYKSLLNK